MKWLAIRLAPRRASEDAWRTRPSGTPETYWDSIDMPHRSPLIAAIESVGSVTSVLELGCSAAPNLRLLRRETPDRRLAGVDIHADAIEFARTRLERTGDDIELEVGSYREALERRADASVDVVFSCYALAYLPAPELQHVLGESLRVAAHAVVIYEPHASPEQPAGRINDDPQWRHDYARALHDLGAVVESRATPDVHDTLESILIARPSDG